VLLLREAPATVTEPTIRAETAGAAPREGTPSAS
jgi:hypothetical protein